MIYRPEPANERKQRLREQAKFGAIKSVVAQLEPAASEKVALDPQVITLSTAISLKRIADALEPTIITGRPEPSKVRELLDVLDPSVDIESLAGDMLNITGTEVAAMSIEEQGILIRRLASAVLRKANK